MIDRGIVRDLENPGGELEFRPVGFDAVQDFDERFLREILGERAIAHHPIQQRKHGTLVATDELAECRVVTLLGPRDDLLIAGVAQVVRPIFRAYGSYSSLRPWHVHGDRSALRLPEPPAQPQRGSVLATHRGGAPRLGS